MIPRAWSESRKQTAAATGPGRRCPSPAAPGAPTARRAPRSRGCPGGDRLDRARGDEVDADAARPEVAREVARDALERRLRDAHPVVDRPGDRRVEVQPDDRAPALHQRRERGRERLERERARLERRDRARRRRVEEAAAERVRGRERDRVQHAVDPPPARPQLVGDAGEVLGLVDVELEHVGRRRRGAAPRARSAAGPRPKPVSTISAPSSCAWRGDLERDRAPRDDAGDRAAACRRGSRAAAGPRLSGDRRRASAAPTRAARASRPARSPRRRSPRWPRPRRAGARRRRRREPGARSASGSSAAASSRRLMIPTAARRAHHPELGVGPREHEVGAEVALFIAMYAPPKALRRTTVSLRHARLGEGAHELGAVADHAGLSWRLPGRKPGVSTSTSSGSPKSRRCARTAPPSPRPRRRARRRGGAAGWRRSRPAGPSRRANAHDDVARPARATSRAAAAVDERRAARRGRRRPGAARAGTTAPGSRERRARRVGRGAALAGVLRQVVEQVARPARPRRARRRDEVADAVALVHARAAERGRVDVLAEHLARRRRAGQEHRRVLGHDHEVGQRRRVGAAAGRGAADDRDLRHDAGQRDVSRKIRP